MLPRALLVRSIAAAAVADSLAVVGPTSYQSTTRHNNDHANFDADIQLALLGICDRSLPGKTTPEFAVSTFRSQKTCRGFPKLSMAVENAESPRL